MSSRWRALEENWVATFEANFPKADYEWSARRHPRQYMASYVDAVKCLDGLAYRINFSDEEDLYFRVHVTKGIPGFHWISTERSVT